MIVEAKTDPVGRRAELEADIETAAGAAAEHAARLDALRREHDRVKGDVSAAYEEEARTGEAGIAEAARQKITDLKSEISITKESHEGAKRAQLGARGELATLLHQHFEVFAEECEAETQRALAALRALEGPIKEAASLWRQAEASWWPLVESAPRVKSDNLAATSQVTLSPPPSFPLLGATFRDVAPRPPEVKVGGAENDDAPPAADVTGAKVTLRGEGGAELGFSLPLSDALQGQVRSGELRAADEESAALLEAAVGGYAGW